MSLFSKALVLASLGQLAAAGGSCSGAPCRTDQHCRSKWGWCGITPAHCNAESTWTAACKGQPVTTSLRGATTTVQGSTTAAPTTAPATTTVQGSTTAAPTTAPPSPTEMVPCTYSKTFTYEGWPIQQDSTNVAQMVDRCTNEGISFVNTTDTATCLINSHASGYDYDKWTPQSACPYPLGQQPGVSQEACQTEFSRWKSLGVRMVTLPGGITAQTGIGHGVLNTVRGECALLEFEGRHAVIFQVDIRSWSLELTESTLNHLTNNVVPGGHCFVPKVKPIDCASVQA